MPKLHRCCDLIFMVISLMPLRLSWMSWLIAHYRHQNIWSLIPSWHDVFFFFFKFVLFIAYVCFGGFCGFSCLCYCTGHSCDLAVSVKELQAQECFDPRERFNTEQCLSGTENLAREETEIYGVIACCPRWTSMPASKQPTSEVRKELN